MTPKYPDISVELAGSDGNAFAVMAKVGNALQRNKVPQDEVEMYYAESMSGDYDHLIRTAMRWVEIS
jgi:hypothetical protein